jgi:uncharacterized protein (DUF362 family)
MTGGNQVPDSPRVALVTGARGYPWRSPYSPGRIYPEYPFGSAPLADQANDVYESVRETLRRLGLDEEHCGRKEWNPLGALIRPGNTVVLKPNLVRHFRETQAGHADCLTTHGSVLRAALDYAYIALKGTGRLIIADAPQNDADFDVLRRIAGLNDLQEFYRRYAGFVVEVLDLRPQQARKINGIIVGHQALPGDPAGCVKVDLGRHSMFLEVEHLCHRLYGEGYDTREVRRHHTGGLHEYLISRTVLGADCLINLPKLKTHKKTGITVCLKNLVGTSGNKNWLPHHREGTPSQGGDQFADDGWQHWIERAVMIGFRRLFPLVGPLRGIAARPLKALGREIFGDTDINAIRSGNWYGNDTTWRMVLDLNRIFRYADCQGCLQDRPARRMFCIVDGIVAGEGNGPLDPTPKAAGVVLAGINALAVDLVSAQLMGFDYRKLPLLRRGLANHALPLATFASEEAACPGDGGVRQGLLAAAAGPHLRFRPHFGWQGHLELDGSVRLGNEYVCAE